MRVSTLACTCTALKNSRPLMSSTPAHTHPSAVGMMPTQRSTHSPAEFFSSGSFCSILSRRAGPSGRSGDLAIAEPREEVVEVLLVAVVAVPVTVVHRRLDRLLHLVGYVLGVAVAADEGHRDGGRLAA